MPENLSRVRLDTGLDYQAEAEVVQAFEKMRADKVEADAHIDELQKQLDSVAAERDTLKSQVASADKVRADALATARAEIKARATLEKSAEAFKIDCADKSDREIKESVIKSKRADADLSGKSDDYINAAFDLTVELKADEAMAEQRKAGRADGGEQKPANTYRNFMKQLGKKE